MVLPVQDNKALLELGAVTRLHAGENAYGASPAVLRAIADEAREAHRYPDGPATELRQAIAQFHGVNPDRVTVGNGIDELILLLVLALADQNRPAVVTEATFASYVESLAAARRPFDVYPLRDYRLPSAEIGAALRTGTPLAFVCNPHNPTGTALDVTELGTLCRAAAAGGGVLVVDEAYAEFAGPAFRSAIPGGPNVVVLRTFSKAYGLAGLRVGYAVADPELIALVDRLHGGIPYHVNRIAQRAAIAALADQAHMQQTVACTIATREWVRHELKRRGLRCPPSSGNFVLLNLGADATPTAQALDALGVQVRDTSAMGLPGHIRMSIGIHEEMRTALAALTHARPTCSSVSSRAGEVEDD